MINSISVSQLFDGETFYQNKTVVIEQGIIIDIIDSHTNDDPHQGLLTPGFIDLQVNGGGGVLFNEKPILSSLMKISQSHHAFGTTAMLPTLISDDIETMHCAADAISQAVSQKVPGIIGIHFEGPHIAVAKKRGRIIQKIFAPCLKMNCVFSSEKILERLW